MQPPATDDTRMPIAVLHENNAWGCNELVMGYHGFAWTFTPLHHQNFPVGMFHLFCKKIPEQRHWSGGEAYEYRGIYIAHRLDVTLPARIWRQLSEPVRHPLVYLLPPRANMSFRSREPTGPKACRKDPL